MNESGSEQGIARVRRVKTYVLVSLGVLFVVIAAVGVFLPGIPTVGPLLLASLMFTKSFPTLERRLIRNKFFARFLPYLDGSNELPLRAKLFSIVLMWCSILLSCVFLYLSGVVPNRVLLLLPVAGLTGTVFILRFEQHR